ncbi:hypothetical protein M758_1G098600 [Ceratodon purpureus]|uniref:Uncharacterized protein n=1 Tax=Ceratodon purpureus TaxID=3225 RepID=A0A8T0J4L2_CERPU|nr:hypothetical protein KC19_1G109200 [Ceratodon purpureus]KAG0629374.1 hypothetical protein M758_1G098600 [Ceratodon purpureus]
MPEKANHSGFDKCNSCASTSDGPELGPLSTVSHPQVCCLFKVARQGQSAPFLNEGSQKRYDGFCDYCPSRKSSMEFHAGPVDRPPPSSSDAPQAGIVALATGCEAAPEVTRSPSRKRKKIEPRKREGFKNLTLEWRPPKFKAKIWFGTYSKDEIERARDAVNYYLGRNEAYFLDDSPRIFAERPLMGIRFEDLLPSCDQVIDKQILRERSLMGIKFEDFLPSCDQVMDTLPAYVIYGRQVKEVIHSVLGKQKKSAERKSKCKESQFLLKEAPQKLHIYDPIVPSASGSPTSSVSQREDCDHSSEANSQLSSSYPMVLPPPSFTQDDEELTALLLSTTQIHLDELPHNHWGDGQLSLNEMFALPTSGDGESSTMEDIGYSTALWDYFPNEGPSFPYG